MRYELIKFLLLIFCLSKNSYGQAIFEKTISFYTTNQQGGEYFISALCEKNFNLINGYGAVSSNGPTDIFFVKTDTVGNVLVKKRLTRSDIAMAYRYSETYNPIFKLYNKNYLFSGSGYAYANSGYTARYDLYFIETDSNVNIMKMNSIAPDSDAVLIGALKYVYPTSDKGILGLCNLRYYNTKLSDVYCVKIDSQYNILWAKKFHKYPDSSTYLIKSIETKDSTYLICAGNSYTTTLGYGIRNTILLIKMDKNGNLIFNKEYKLLDTTYGIEAVDIIELSNGDILMPFRIHPVEFTWKPKNGLLRVNNNGDIIFSKRFYSTIDTLSLIFLITLYENDKQIIGYLQSPVSSNILNGIKGVCTIFDDMGNFIIAKYYNSQFNEFYNYRSFISNTYNKNGYFIGGIQADGSAFNSLKLLIKRISPFLESCSSVDIQLLVDSININTTTDTLVIQNAKSTISTWTPTMIEGGTDSTLCFCPNIPVSIQQTPVNCYSNGSATITPTNAGNYTYYWSPPVSTTNTASNLSAGTYTVQIMDSTGCKKTAVITITTNFNLPLSISGQTQICSGQTDTLILHGAQALTWNTGQTDSIILVQPNVTTTYSAVVVNGSCQDSVYFTVNVLPTPTLLVTPTSYTLNIGDTALVQASGAAYYSWLPAFGVFTPNAATTLITPTATTEYCVLGRDSSQRCVDTACVKLFVDGTCFDIRLPNVFTPNDDNINDVWKPDFPCPQLITKYELLIYDRWGVKLFEATKPNTSWNGRTLSGEAVPTGTYFYTIEFILNNKKEKRKGYITLMR